MANSQFEYVKKFENAFTLLPSTYIVLRIDGKAFTEFAELHHYEKPNDIKGLELMNKAAEEVMNNFSEIWFAQGESDEQSFVFRKNTTLFNRRSDKILTCVTSCFSSAFTMHFNQYFPSKKLLKIPIFDGRCVCQPNAKTLRDYLSWRQCDCHINNLQNTCFWELIHKKSMTPKDAHLLLKDTNSSQKNEILFSQFGVNQAKGEAIYRRGSILLRVKNEELSDFYNKLKETPKENKKESETEEISKQILEKNKEKEKAEIAETKEANEPEKKSKKGSTIVKIHENIIAEDFWTQFANYLSIEE